MVTLALRFYFLSLIGIFVGEYALQAHSSGIEKCSKRIQDLGATPAVILKALQSRILGNGIPIESQSDWIEHSGIELAAGTFDGVFDESQKSLLLSTYLQVVENQKLPLTTTSPRLASILVLKQILLSGILSTDLRMRLREDLWNALLKMEESDPFNFDDDRITFGEHLLEAIVLTYRSNQFSDSVFTDSVLAELASIDREESPKDNLHRLARVQSLIRDYLVVSPKVLSEMKQFIEDLLRDFKEDQNPALIASARSLYHSIEEQQRLAVPVARMIASGEFYERRILLGELSSNQVVGYVLNAENLETKRAKALRMLGFHVTMPQTSRQYLDIFVKTASRSMHFDPLLVLATLSAVERDLRASLERPDLTSEQRSSLKISHERVRSEFFSTPASNERGPRK